MKANEVKLEGINMVNFNAKPGSHYKIAMHMGRVFPSTRAQAIEFIRSGAVLNVLCGKDVEMIEKFLNKHGYQGEYRYTKSRAFVRLQNNRDLYKAIASEFIEGKN